MLTKTKHIPESVDVPIERQPYTELRKDRKHLEFICALAGMRKEDMFKGLPLGAFLYQAIREFADQVASVGVKGDDEWTCCAICINAMMDADIENMKADADEVAA
jgi:hypothetical protein